MTQDQRRKRLERLEQPPEPPYDPNVEVIRITLGDPSEQAERGR